MSRFATVASIGFVLLASVAFAALNGGQWITLRLGLVTFYRVPLTVVAFGGVILGMVIMLVAGVSADLRVRRILRERLAQEDREEKARLFVDQNQTNLFDSEPE